MKSTLKEKLHSLKRKYVRPVGEFYVKIKFYMNKGDEQFFYLITLGKYNVYFSAGWLLLFDSKPPLWLLIGGTVVWVWINLGVGWLWDRLKMFNIEKDFSNERDNFVTKVQQELLDKKKDGKKNKSKKR